TAAISGSRANGTGFTIVQPRGQDASNSRKARRNSAETGDHWPVPRRTQRERPAPSRQQEARHADLQDQPGLRRQHLEAATDPDAM
ncbi:hypothetical protein L915_05761, partial [Phytophthora nicotianae]